MKSVWRALIWKEWHEHKWKLVALTAVLISLPSLTLLSKDPSNVFGTISATMWFAVPLFSFFIAATIAAGENSQRTMPFVQSLAFPPWKLAIVKLGIALATVCIPVVAVIAFAMLVNLDHILDSGISGDRIFFVQSDNWHLSRLLFGTLAGASIIIWVAAIGVNRIDEVRAGALGFLGMVAFALLLVLLGWKFDLWGSRLPMWFRTLGSIGPCGPVFLMWSYHPFEPTIAALTTFWPILLASIFVHAVLAMIYVVRFGKESHSYRFSERSARATDGEWLALPRRTRFGALAWKQLRESGPLALVAMCMIFFMWVVFAYMLIFEGEPPTREWRSRLANDWIGYTVATWMFLGFFVAIVAGIGVFFEELRPGVNNFWRSWPINHDLWFWTKYLFGMGVTFAAITLPVLLSAVIVRQLDFSIRGNIHSLAGAALVLLFQATVFATALLAMLTLRQAIYAAVVALTPIALIPFLIDYFNWQNVGLASYLGVVFILATLLAWLAVRYDWSLRR